MLPGRFRQSLHSIAADRKSGAIELAVDVVDAFLELSESGDIPAREELQAVVSFLGKAQPSMVPIFNTARICAETVARHSGAGARLVKLRSFLEESRARVAENALRLFPPGTTCITLSRSSTVLAALKRAAAEGRIERLYVMESRPRLEGRVTAKELVAEGVECILVADALGPSMAGEVDMAVVGADAILKDGAVVNKSGTYPLALAFHAANKPMAVLAESIKLDSRYDSNTWPGSELRGEGELLPKPPRALKALNRYFDLTPPANVHAVVHEGGVARRNWATDLEKVLHGLFRERA